MEDDLFSAPSNTFTSINNTEITEEHSVAPKAEEQEDTPMVNLPAEDPSPSTTPRKRGRKPGISKTNNDDDDDDPSSTPNKRGRPSKKEMTGSPAKGLGPIPVSLEAAGEADKLILRMKDEENRPWAEIIDAWTKMTGGKVGPSTIRVRYTRMKSNFVSICPEDELRLIRLKTEIEENFEQEKWAKLVKAIEDEGGNKYPPAALQKKFKEMSKSKGVASTPDTPSKAEE